MRRLLLFPFFLLLALGAQAQEKKSTAVTWKKIVLDKAFRSEGVGVADFNKDGKLDVVVGDCWYEAPQEPDGPWKRHLLRADRVFGQTVYSDSFCCFTDDFNGDTWPDVIVIPFPGAPCYWYQNPGATGGKWQPHLLTNSACNETPIHVDLFKTGKKLLVMGWNPPKDASDLKKGNHDDRGEMCYFVPGKDATQPWQRISISGPSAKGKPIPGTARFAHGLGHGDVNGDGRLDVIVPQGWWEQPEKADGAPWKFHAANITGPCADMYTIDIDNNGKADIVSTSAHNYGFWWSEQKDAGSFVQRVVFPNPFEVAKLPSQLKLAAEEKGLIDAINKYRTDHLKRAPLAVDPQLCELARQQLQHETRGSKDKLDLKSMYPGAVRITKHGLAADKLTPEAWKALAQTLLPDGDKDRHWAQPHMEMGVATEQGRDGKTRFLLLLGDRGKFSLPSQTHALQHVDIDGDGVKDLVTGRRWWAHGPKGDAGPNDPAYLYWFQARRGRDGMMSFTPHEIDADSGVGTSFAIADMNGDQRPDIIVANKKGVHVFLQGR